MSGICLILLGVLFIIVGKYNSNNTTKNNNEYIRGYQDALKSLNSRHEMEELDDESDN